MTLIRPKLFQVIPTDDYKVYLYYGKIKFYNCSWILNKNDARWKKSGDLNLKDTMFLEKGA